MCRVTSYVVKNPSATVQSTEVSALSKQLLGQKHDEIALIFFRIENAIKARQKTDTRMSWTATPKLWRNVILRAKSTLQSNKQLVNPALNKHDGSVDRTSAH
jgi:hypothetical protein